MDRLSGFEGRVPEKRPSQRIGVHVLSEHVFCPRAAMLALESRQADDGEAEPPLGPRLDGFYDYNELRFAEEARTAWGEIRRCLTWLAPAMLVPFAAWRFHSLFAATVLSLPALFFVARLVDACGRLFAIARARALYRAAPETAVDLSPESITKVNWWTLRKAGFDCQRPADTYSTEVLAGRPWRLLVKDTMWRIPVLRKHYGEQVFRSQHLVRAAAYCELVEACEGGRAPFAVLMFAGSYDCLIIPHTAHSRTTLDNALDEMNQFLRVQETGRFIPAEPTDNRCSGCPWGRPVPFSETTILNGHELPPLRIEGIRKGDFHCACGDRFNWVPKHNDTLRLRGELT